MSNLLFSDAEAEVETPPEVLPRPTTLAGRRARRAPVAAAVPDPAGPAELQQDPEPEYLTGPARGARGKGKARSKAAPVRVTEAVKKDIRAKTAMMLTLPATAFALRDPYCGGVAREIVPDTAEALTEIFIESADVVAWFTAGSGYLRYIKLLTVLQPLFSAIGAHHVTHTAGHQDADRPAVDYNDAYPAG